jgi:hypothetical protein
MNIDINLDYDLISQFEYVGFEKLLPHVVCINEKSTICENKVVDNTINLITKARKQKLLPILNWSTNPVEFFEQHLKTLGNCVSPDEFFVLGPDCRYEKYPYSNVAPWPSAFLHQQRACVNQMSNFKKTHRISVLARQARLHRLHLWKSIRPWVTDQDVVVVNTVVQNNLPVDVANSAEAMTWIQELPWANKPEFIDLTNTSDQNFNYTDMHYPAYHAMVNITNESWAKNNLTFVTEKTWKPYISSCLVINYGSPNVPLALEKLGFEIWKDYDTCVDYQQKISLITELFKRDDIHKLYEKNHDMIRHNQNLATSWHFARKLVLPTFEKIENLI